MRPRSLFASLALAPAALVIACGVEDPPKYNIASTEQALSDPLDEMPLNGYPPDGLDVNYALLSTIWQNPLNYNGIAATLATVAPRAPGADGIPVLISTLFKTGLPTSAEYLMDEIVSCAFDLNHDVSYPFDNPSHIRTSSGQFGLCEVDSFGDWQTAGANPQCRYMVSACILARMNARHKHVPISIRVPQTFAGRIPYFRPVDKVRVQPMLRNGNLAAPDWQPDFVGICTRGTEVTLERTATMGRAVRVCTGIHACNPDVPPDFIIPGSPRVYSGFWKEYPSGTGSISFTCPANSATAPSGKPGQAYFSILTKPPGPVGAPSSEPMLVLTPIPNPTTTYPAPEKDVFTYVEGAFYGNILPVPTANLDRNACSSAVWKEGTMYETGRVCADPGNSYECLTRSGLCDQDSGARDQLGNQAFYLFTREPSYLSWYGVTVFLNDPNAILSDTNDPNVPLNIHNAIVKASAIQSVHDVCTPGASLTSDGPGGVVTKVCGADPYCCSAAWDSRCVSEVREVQTGMHSPACGTVPCSHPACTTGDKLTNGCSPVVTSVCTADSYCCNTAWDSKCVSEVQTVAHSPACACSHPVCTLGPELANGCSPVVTNICAVDPFCCNTAWDSTCIQEVQTVAHSPECIPP